jgi:hypothetical protein
MNRPAIGIAWTTEQNRRKIKEAACVTTSGPKCREETPKEGMRSNSVTAPQ